MVTLIVSFINLVHAGGRPKIIGVTLDWVTLGQERYCIISAILSQPLDGTGLDLASDWIVVITVQTDTKKRPVSRMML